MIFEDFFLHGRIVNNGSFCQTALRNLNRCFGGVIASKTC